MLDALSHELAAVSGPLLGIGDLRSLAGLQERLPGLVLLDNAPQRQRGQVQQRVIRGDPLDLPFAEAALDGVIAVTALSHHADAAALLRGWARHLRSGAQLIVAEPLIRSGTGRRLQRLLGGPRFARPADELTGLLLNAGFGDIGQRLAGPRGVTLVTSGRLRGL